MLLKAQTATLCLLVGLLISASCLSAQLIEERQYHGRTITCAVSGLRGFSSTCGASSGYEAVFIGNVISARDEANDEKTLVLMPEENFVGSYNGAIEVTTSQGDCLPEIAAGDKWLFYLRLDRKTKKMVLAYGSPSAPLSDAEKDVLLLRRLRTMSQAGVVLGTVQRIEWENHIESYYPAVAHKVVAVRKSDRAEFHSTTDKDGYFEFESLPPGSYDISGNTTPGVWAEEGTVDVAAHSCNKVDLELAVDGAISGHLLDTDGKPAATKQVELLTEDRQESRSTWTDKDGYFEFRGLRPGKYLVGIGIQLGPDRKQTGIYYPGVRSRALATVIEIGKAGKKENIDLSLQTR